MVWERKKQQIVKNKRRLLMIARDELSDFVKWLCYSGFYTAGSIIIPIDKAGDVIRTYRTEVINGRI